MTSFHQGGNRRIDRVLGADFLTDLSTMSIDELRDRRRLAEQEEVDQSYIRRLLQGRIDIVRAEQVRRSAGDADDLVEHLAEVLADEAPAPAHGLGRHLSVEPSESEAHRRAHELLLDDTSRSDVRVRTDEELQSDLDGFAEKEREVSAQRRAVQQVMDRCSEEVARRYRDGEADVSSLLAGGEH